MKTSIIILLLAASPILLQSCLSTARLTDYPRTAQSYDFTKIANSKQTDPGKKWTSKTNFEYYLKTEPVDDSELLRAITESLKTEQYVIKHIDSDNGAILGERGLRANEWKSVIGVYFQKANTGFEIYIKATISQDITGGVRDNRAEKVGTRICLGLGNCEQSYPVKTTE